MGRVLDTALCCYTLRHEKTALVVLPNLPPGITQTVLISGSTYCPGQDPPCESYRGGNWFAATQGGSGGIHYDSVSNLLIAQPNGEPGQINEEGSSQAVGAIQKLSPAGAVSAFLNFGQLPQSCIQTSATSLTEFYPYVIQPFSLNPGLGILYLVTVNRASFFTWNSGTTTGSCNGSGPIFNGPYTVTADAYTYATLALTGSEL